MNSKKSVVYFNHGRDSGPWGIKIQHLAQVARPRGWEVESLDYQGIYDPERRVEMLLASDAKQADRLVLVGSSMGGYVAAAASAELQPRGLFLMAPAFYIPKYPLQEPEPRAEKIIVIHGWQDEVIPVDHSLQYARKFKAELHVLEDGHRLQGHLALLDALFGAFLDEIDSSGVLYAS